MAGGCLLYNNHRIPYEEEKMNKDNANEQKPNNPPAFPCSIDVGIFKGLTMRDYFAAAALTGILSSGAMMALREKTGDEACDIITRSAYEYADSMLKARGESWEPL